MKFQPALYTLLGILIVFSFTACAPSAQIVGSWKAPGVSVDLDSVKKILCIAQIKNETDRRVAEDKLVKALKGKGVPSYQVLTNQQLGEPTQDLQQELKKDGYNGVVSMRLIDVQKEQTWVQGGVYPVYYGSYWTYHPYAWGYYMDPGYVVTNHKYDVETNVYSLKRDKLIWSAVTTTYDPNDIDELVDGIVNAMTKKMKDDGFLVTKK